MIERTSDSVSLCNDHSTVKEVRLTRSNMQLRMVSSKRLLVALGTAYDVSLDDTGVSYQRYDPSTDPAADKLP